MNKQEEKKLKKVIEKNFIDGICNSQFSIFEEAKNWITEHDKREKERLIEEIKNEINSSYKIVIQDNIEYILNNHK